MRRQLGVLVALAATYWVVSATASTTLGGQPVTVSQVCTKAASALQHCSPAQNSGSQSLCCNATRILEDLGCFCMDATKESSRSAVSLSVWATLPACKLPQPLDFNSCNSTNGATMLPGVPGVFRVPGKGLVQVSALQFALDSNIQTSQPQQQPSRGLTADQLSSLALETRPVMDLSAIPDDVSVIFASDSKTDMTVTITEASDSTSDMSVSFDLDLPTKLLAEGVEFDLEIVDSDNTDAWNGVSFSLDVDIPEGGDSDITLEIDSNLPSSVAMTYTSEATSEDGLDATQRISIGLDQPETPLGDDLELGIDISDTELVRQLTDLDATDSVLTMEVDIPLSEKVVRTLGGSDVNVQLGVDVLEGGALSETAITVERDSLSLPLSGQGLGILLVEAAEWLSAFMPVPLADEDYSGESDEMVNALGDALQLMSEVGEEISARIPREQLRAGDTIEVLLDESDEEKVRWADRIEWTQVMDVAPSDGAAQLLSRRALDSLSDAVKSALYTKQAEQGMQEEVACSLCEFVNSHLQLLWGLVYLNVSLLFLCGTIAAIQSLRRRASAVPTVPDSDLEQPLIVNAADYADDDLGFSKKMLLQPVWEPASKAGQ